MAVRPWIGVAGVAAFAAVVTWFGILHRDEAAAPPASSSSQTAASPPTAPGSAPVPAETPPAPGGTEAAPAESSPPPAASDASRRSAAVEPSRTVGKLPLPPPTFDVVRVEPSGDTVVAGEGAPGATVELLRNGETYARSVADGGGQWAIVPAPLPKGAALLTLRVTTPDGRIAASDQVVTVQVPEKTGDGVVVVLNAPDTPSRVLTAEGVAAARPDAQPAPTGPKVALESSAAGQRDATTPPSMTAPVKTEPAAPKVAAIDASGTPPASGEPARAGSGTPPATGTKILAAAPNARSRANARVVTVEADESGRFFVTGQAEPGAEIRIYLNETALATVQAAADGGFGMTIEKGMTPGDYRVRIDDIEPGSGKVLTRAEVPFTMGSPRKAVAAATPAQDPAKIAAAAGPSEPAKVEPLTAKPSPEKPSPEKPSPEKPSTAEPSPATPAVPPTPKVLASREPKVLASREPKVLASRDISPSSTPIDPPAPASPPAPSSPTAAVEPASPQSPQEGTPPPAETAQPTPPAGDVAPAVAAPGSAQLPAASPAPAAGSRAPEPQGEPNVALATPGDAPAAGASEPAPAAGASEPAPAGNVDVAAKPLTPSPSVAVIPEIKTVIVARGDNLWRISRKTYGRGTRYTIIYGANSEQIRNPDLIYPGQIFVTPDDKG